MFWRIGQVWITGFIVKDLILIMKCGFLKVGFDCFGELGMWVLVGTMFCVGDGLVRAVRYERGGEDLDV